MLAVALLVGIGQTFVDNAFQSVLPQIVNREWLDRANGRLYAGHVVAGQFLGHGLAGILFASAAAFPFLLDAAMFAASSALVLGLAKQRPAVAIPSRKSPLLADVKEGIGWLLRQRFLRNMWLMLTTLGLASGAFWGIVPLYSIEILHLPSSGYGVMLAVGAAGSLIGSLVASPVRKRIGTVPTIHTAVAIITVAAIGLALATSVLVATTFMIFNGIGVLLWNVISASLRQTLTPDRLLGRVSAAFRFGALGAMALGAVLAGVIATVFGLPSVFWFSAGVVLLGALLTAPAMKAAGFPATSAGSDSPPKRNE